MGIDEQIDGYKELYERGHVRDATIPALPEDLISDEAALITHCFPPVSLAPAPYVQPVRTHSFKAKGVGPRVKEGFARSLFDQTMPGWVPFRADASPTFTFIDLFAGIGGFRMAFQNTGGKCVYSSEWDREARRVYFANYGEVPFGDITLESNKRYIPSHYDLLAAGFPCQPFSISGKMRGFEDTRGTLIYEVFDIVRRHFPQVVLLENVKQLRYHDHGKTLRVILRSLSELGYNVSWSVLNASNFGVPQNRERILIVATRDGTFSFERLANMSHRTTMRSVLEVDPADGFEYLEEPYTLLSPDEIRIQKSGLIFVGYRNKKIRDKGVRPGTNHLSRVHKQPNRIYSAEGVHPALPSQETSGRFWILDGERVRKLTPLECYRLMGFPDTFIRSEVLGEQYRQIGNSVCVPMAEQISLELQRQGFIGSSISPQSSFPDQSLAVL